MFIYEHLIQYLYMKKLGMLFWRLLLNTFLKCHNLFELFFWEWRREEVGGREESEMFIRSYSALGVILQPILSVPPLRNLY